MNTSKNNVDNFGVKEKQDGQCAALLLFYSHIVYKSEDNHKIMIVLTTQHRPEIWIRKQVRMY
nr:MAG TPA: hypothetical protein [Caudoviricetes sp.]